MYILSLIPRLFEILMMVSLTKGVSEKVKEQSAEKKNRKTFEICQKRRAQRKVFRNENKKFRRHKRRKL